MDWLVPYSLMLAKERKPIPDTRCSGGLKGLKSKFRPSIQAS